MKNASEKDPYVIVLGVAQDAGYPQINCQKKCCMRAWENPQLKKHATCLAIVDPSSKQQWIIDATPDLKHQLHVLKSQSLIESIDGFLLTHAHVGHYAGLIHLGKEIMGAEKIPVYAMRKMKEFIEKNKPWNQLVKLNNININLINEKSEYKLNENVTIKPFLVPHRTEFSETVGYNIIINNKTLIFIPDIDKWEEWNIKIENIIPNIDYAFIDGTFYKDGEVNRDMSKIPHPLIEETMKRCNKLSKSDKSKIHFIHFNHTNPLLIKGSKDQMSVQKNGYNIAEEGMIINF